MTVSLSGLDLSFLRKNDPSACQPGRYRIDPESGEAIPAHEHARRFRQRPDRRGTVASPYFMPDVDAAYGGAWKSIIDGTEISSRTNWREHNKRNGVLQVDPDYWGKTEDHHVTQIRDRMQFGKQSDDPLVTSAWRTPSTTDI